MNIWLQAYNNILDIEDKMDQCTEEEHKIYDCWKHILSSKFVYMIVMNYITPCDMFKRAFEYLIQQPFSIKLYESALYPISFLFTPNMLGKQGYEAPISCFNKTAATYKKNLQLEILKFGSVSNSASSYQDLNWIYYLNRTDEYNQMITLLHQAVTFVDKQEGKESEDGDGEEDDE